MSWGNPWILIALAIPLLGAFGIRRLMRQTPRPQWPAMMRVAISGHRVRPATPRRSRPAFLVMLAIALAVVAIARPQWGEHIEESFSHTREVIIALDLSRSMLTEDVTPSRLEHAKRIIGDLLSSLKGESVGLVVFAGTAFVQVPLSPDYQIVREFMPSLDTDYMPQGGSDYSRMLDAALEGFSEAPDRDRYLIVLSDGESSTESWNARLDALSKRQIHVLSMGLGTEKGGFIPDQQGGYMADANGDVVNSKLMPATLQALARRTNGKFVNASSLEGVGDVRALLAETVETGRKGRVGNESSVVQSERFQWFLLPAVLLGLVSLATEFRQRPKPRQVRPLAAPPEASAQADTAGEKAAARAESNKGPSSLAAGIALLAVALGVTPDARAHFDSQAEFEVREVFDSNPVQRLRAITEHLAEFDYDAYDLRLMVEEAIKYGIDAQRTGLMPSEGVLRDAIEASRHGQQLDASIADWSYYRSQLTAMLAPAEEAAAKEESSQAKKELLDEEDNPPITTGDSSQQSATDSFGQGASSKTDATLGDLSADKDAPVQRRKPTPPGKARTATARSPTSEGGGPQDAILALSKKRLDDVAKKDSPGRVHQLLSGGTQQRDSNQVDW
jgi:Ca-activated chloride channel homolog